MGYASPTTSTSSGTPRAWRGAGGHAVCHRRLALYTRGLAFAATGRRETAARELAELETIRRGVPFERTLAAFFKTQDMLLLAAEALAGEIAARAGDTASAVRHFGEAVKVQDNRRVPRIVDVLPNGPVGHPTVRVFLAGGVPEVMPHLRRGGLLDEDCLTVAGERLGRLLDWWEGSARRRVLRDRLRAADGVDPDAVIMDPERARRRGLTSTVTFPRGNLAPEGAVIKSTAIDPSVVDADGVYRKRGPARVFTRERAAIAAIKSRGEDRIRPGDVLVLICRGPLGAGMEEIYQITAALKHLSLGKHVAVLTDARFSGVSTGACIGHIGPEALAGGPIGKVLDGDLIQIVVDRIRLEGSIDLVGRGSETFGAEEGARALAARPPRSDLAPDPDLPADTRLWAALQQVGGGTWGGCVYDIDAIISALAGRR